MKNKKYLLRAALIMLALIVPTGCKKEEKFGLTEKEAETLLEELSEYAATINESLESSQKEISENKNTSEPTSLEEIKFPTLPEKMKEVFYFASYSNDPGEFSVNFAFNSYNYFVDLDGEITILHPDKTPYISSGGLDFYEHNGGVLYSTNTKLIRKFESFMSSEEYDECLKLEDGFTEKDYEEMEAYLKAQAAAFLAYERLSQTPKLEKK